MRARLGGAAVPVAAMRYPAASVVLGDGDRAGPLLAVHVPGHAADHLVFVARRPGGVHRRRGARRSGASSSRPAAARSAATSTGCGGCARWASSACSPATARSSRTRRRSSTSTSRTGSSASAASSRRSQAGARTEDELLAAAWDEIPDGLRLPAALDASRPPREAPRTTKDGSDAVLSGQRRRFRQGQRAAASGVTSSRVGEVEQRADGVADGEHALAGAAGVVALRLQLDGDVDDAARVGDEVRRPEDPAGVQQRRRSRRRRAGCWRRRRPRGSAAPAPMASSSIAAQRARARRGRRRRAARRPARSRPRPAPPRARASPAPRRRAASEAPRRGEPARERAADVAEPDHRDPCGPRGRRCPKARSQVDADRGLDAERRPRARIAGAAALEREPGDVRRSRSAITVMSPSEVPTSSAVM